jgi:ketosteroid isomerase-like protein
VWDGADSELVDLRAVGDHVVSIYRYRGRGRRSGLPVQEDFATLSTVEAGKVTRVKWFVRPEDALEAAAPTA